MGDFSKVSSTAFEDLQFDAGTLLKDFDPANPVIEDNAIICLTTGGITATCVPTFVDDGADIDRINLELYPALSKYNQTKDPNIQTYLAGIYRKTKVPDAFGPLCVMLIQNAINPHKNCHFDPNEEIGGAILDYLA
jgi:hypothetical protein